MFMKIICSIGIFLLISVKYAYANAVWQSIYFEPGFRWLIPAALFIEWFAVYKFLIRNLYSSVVVTVWMNIISLFFGIIIMQLPILRNITYTDLILTNIMHVATMIAINISSESIAMKLFMKSLPNLKILIVIGTANLITVIGTVAAFYLAI